MMVFGKKKLAKKLAELERQKEQQEQAQRWNELKIQEQIRIQIEEHRLKEQQWESERQEHLRKEHEQLVKEQLEQECRAREELQKKEREQRRVRKLKLTTPDALRGLRDLIRTRYQLDMDIWSLKGVRAPDRPLVVEKMEKADAVLMEIHTMVETWEENDEIWTAEEWKLAQTIKERIQAEGKRWWANNPPWNED
jgi:hypothetical protein